MDRETEIRLSLYLDDQLSDTDRKAFEARLATDGELRRAVRLHRTAAEEMAAMPEVPAGLIAGARARLADPSDATAASGWWHRFWSLEIAGLVAAGAIVAAVLYPFVAPRDFVSSRKEPRDLVTIGESASRPEAILLESREAGDGAEREEKNKTGLQNRRGNDSDDAAVGKDNDPAKQNQTDTLRSLGYLAEEDSEAGKKAKPDTDGFAFDKNLAIDSTLRADSAENAPAARSAEAEKTAPSPVGGLVPAEEPVPDRSREAEQGKTVETDEIVAQDAGRQSGDRSSAKGEALSAPARDLAYRIIPLGADSPLNESGYLVLQNDADWKQAGGEEPIDFARQMAILIPAYRSTRPPVRIQVIRVQSSADAIVVWTLDVPIGAEAGAAPDVQAARQAILVPAADTPVRLRQGE